MALTPVDAQRLGLDVGNLDYVHPVTTANGVTKAALVKLDYVTVAGARVRTSTPWLVREGPVDLAPRHDLSWPPVAVRGDPDPP